MNEIRFEVRHFIGTYAEMSSVDLSTTDVGAGSTYYAYDIDVLYEFNGSAFRPIHNMDFLHQEVHEGGLFTVNYIFEDVENNAYATIAIVTGAKQFHGIATVDCEGKAYLNTYSGATLSANGTEITQFNRNATSPNTPVSKIYHTPQMKSNGTIRFDRLVLGGLGPLSTGSQGGDREESIFAPNTKTLLRIQNISGQTKDFGVALDWYEV